MSEQYPEQHAPWRPGRALIIDVSTLRHIGPITFAGMMMASRRADLRLLLITREAHQKFLSERGAK